MPRLTKSAARQRQEKGIQQNELFRPATSCGRADLLDSDVQGRATDAAGMPPSSASSASSFSSSSSHSASWASLT